VQPPSSNFISHLTSCIAQQQSLMKEFTKCGLENPVQQVTWRGFRERLVKGIVQDDLTFSLSKGGGMKGMLLCLLLKGWMVPTHHTVHRDVNLLYDKINSQLNYELKVTSLPTLSALSGN
jgi:hypothetical protein